MSEPTGHSGDGRRGGEPLGRRRALVASLDDPGAIAQLDPDSARFVFETIELAAVEAEALVAPRGGGCGRRGRCRVAVRFPDERLLAAFAGIGAVERGKDLSWRLVRRWAEAGGSARLDAAMCHCVVRRLHRTFGWRIRARVVAACRD